jgi:hypothetical protein
MAMQTIMSSAPATRNAEFEIVDDMRPPASTCFLLWFLNWLPESEGK